MKWWSVCLSLLQNREHTWSVTGVAERYQENSEMRDRDQGRKKVNVEVFYLISNVETDQPTLN